MFAVLYSVFELVLSISLLCVWQGNKKCTMQNAVELDVLGLIKKLRLLSVQFDLYHPGYLFSKKMSRVVEVKLDIEET